MTPYSRSPSPHEARPAEPGPALGYSSRSTYGDQADYYTSDPAATYGLADEPSYEAQRRGPGKKVRTTLGRAQRDRQRPIIAVDSNARMLSALRPGLIPAAQVRVLDEQEYVPAVMPRRPAAMLHLRPLVAREPALYRLLLGALALLVTAAYLLALLHFDARAGIDAGGQAQLLAGRLLAQDQTVKYVPADPLEFVGDGWIPTGSAVVAESGSAVQEYVPKAPLGLPLIYALAYRLAPTPGQALEWAYLVNPVCAALAVLACFFLGRFAGGSFLGMLVMLAMAGGQVLLGIANDPVGHGVSLALLSWGLLLLLRWWRGGNALLGLAAGLLLGYAFTVRYADVLLGVPVVLACVFAWHWRRPLASTASVLVPILGWALPVAGLLYFNRRVLGDWTAWHVTGELGLLDADNILPNWHHLLAAATDGGLYFLLPLGLMGLLALCARRLPLGLTLLAWFALPLVGYAAYAWAGYGAGYQQVLLRVTPAVLFGAAYVLRRVLYAPSDAAPQLIEGQDPYSGEPVYMLADPPTPLWRAIAAPVAAGLIVAAAVGIGASGAAGAGGLDAHALRHQRLAGTAALANLLNQRLADGAVLFVDAPAGAEGILHHIQVAADFELYDAGMFSSRFARRMGEPWSPTTDAGGPNPMNRQRHEFLGALYGQMGEGEISRAVQRIINRAAEQDREAYLLMNALAVRRFEQAHLLRGYETRTVATFHEWPLLAADGEPLDSAAQPEWSLVKVSIESRLSPAGTIVLAD